MCISMEFYLSLSLIYQFLNSLVILPLNLSFLSTLTTGFTPLFFLLLFLLFSTSSLSVFPTQRRFYLVFNDLFLYWQLLSGPAEASWSLHYTSKATVWSIPSGQNSAHRYPFPSAPHNTSFLILILIATIIFYPSISSLKILQPMKCSLSYTCLHIYLSSYTTIHL